MNQQHSLAACTSGLWVADAELVDGSLEVGEFTPDVSPDSSADFYKCTCGEEFENEVQAVNHLQAVKEESDSDE